MVETVTLDYRNLYKQKYGEEWPGSDADLALIIETAPTENADEAILDEMRSSELD